MDMPWIESHTALERHSKVIRLRAAMRWSRNEAIGFLHRFWWTVLEVSPSGDITALSAPEVMSEALNMPTEVIRKALQIMEDVTLLDRKNGRLLVHDWLEYSGRYLRDSKFKRDPGQWQAILKLHDGRLSADCLPTVGDTRPTVPTRPDQPPNGECGELFKKSPKVETLTLARVALHYLNEKAGKKFTECAEHLTRIECRLKTPGVTIEGVKTMIDRQVAKWAGTERSEYLRPETLFGKEKFMGYYDSRDLPIPKDTNAKPNPRNQNCTGDHDEMSKQLGAEAAKRAKQWT